MKKIKTGAIFLVLTLIVPLVSCLDLTDLNKDPNRPEKVSSNYILTYVLTKTAINYKALGDFNSQIAGTMQYIQVGTNESSWKINHYDWDKGSWAAYYDILRNVQIINQNAVKEENSLFEAVSLTLRAFLFGIITDNFGDLPYSESLKATDELYFPKYDEQKDIYKGIMEDLNRAESLLSGSGISNYSIAATSDIWFGGNIAKWRKFTNSLRLRYAMRLYDKKSDMSALGIDVVSIFNDASSKAISANGENAVVKYIGSNSENSHPGGKLNSSNPQYWRKPCETMVDKLESLNDPRLYRWVEPVQFKWDYNVTTETTKKVTNMFGDSYDVIYMPTTNTNIDTSLYVGLPMGLAVQDAMNYNKGDYTKAFHSERSPFISYIHKRYFENVEPLVQIELFMYSEVEFLLAEAALKGGFSIQGTAESHYKNGILASMNRWNINDGQNGFSFDNYYNDPKVSYSEAENKLERIMEQKWIAGWLTVETWLDWRRTGYPDLKAGPVATYGAALPLRFEYPVPNSDEKYMVNYNAAVERLKPTIYVPSGQSNDHSYSKTWLIQDTGKPYN